MAKEEKNFITIGQVRKMNSRTLSGIRDVRISIPKKFKIIGACCVMFSFVVPDGSAGAVVGFSFLTSTNIKQVPYNFKRLLDSNLKKARAVIRKTYNLRYNKLGIRRF